MKIDINKAKPSQFSPVQISFTIDSVEEYRAFNRMMNRYLEKYTESVAFTPQDEDLATVLKLIKEIWETGNGTLPDNTQLYPS